MGKKYARVEDQVLEGVVQADQRVEQTFYEEMRFWRCAFERCTWVSCKFSRVSFAHSTRFRDCRFISCKFLGQHTHLGGPSSFENCVFEDCSFKNVQLWETHFEGCRFSGTIENVVLFGPEAPAEWQSTFVDVDLTGARLLDVDFRCGFDLGSTKLPAGFELPPKPDEPVFAPLRNILPQEPPMVLSSAENSELRLRYVCAVDCVTDQNLDRVVRHAKDTGSEGLSLVNASLSEAGIRALNSVPRLRYLVLDGSRLTDQALGELTNTQNLEHLSLVRCPLAARFLERAGPLPHLLYLDLSQTLADDRTVTALAGCSNLRTLRLSATRITGRSIAPLVHLSALRLLWLDGTNLGLDSLKAFRKRPEVLVSI